LACLSLFQDFSKADWNQLIKCVKDVGHADSAVVGLEYGMKGRYGGSNTGLPVVECKSGGTWLVVIRSICVV